jgi:hypothetical protein
MVASITGVQSPFRQEPTTSVIDTMTFTIIMECFPVGTDVVNERNFSKRQFSVLLMKQSVIPTGIDSAQHFQQRVDL